jgi:hypothetical protein
MENFCCRSTLLSLRYQHLENYRVQHCPEALENIGTHEIVHGFFEMALGVRLSNIVNHDLFITFSLFLFDAFVVRFAPFQHLVDLLLGGLSMLFEWLHGQTVRPMPLVEVHEHLLFQFILAVVNDNAVVMTVQAMDECLDRRLLQMANIAGRLTRLVTEHHQLWIDQAKAVNDDFALDRLDRIDHQCHSSRMKRFKRALRVNVGGAQPTTKARMLISNEKMVFKIGVRNRQGR